MEHAQIEIRGIVQGVGFRPFIHKLVSSYGLTGYIKNTSSGVELALEGERAMLEHFVQNVPEAAPKLAVIEEMSVSYSGKLEDYSGFEIRKSKTEQSRNTLISPDICICEDCLRELRDEKDRRYKYPFINCTNCGPRFTIIKDVPYDRQKTSMDGFPMCPDCEREYHDIEDRRYHAQPDCCRVCGPSVFFLAKNGQRLDGDAIEIAREKLKHGSIIAIKGLGGIHLACRCDDEALVKTLRRRKQRDEKPFAIMCRDIETARKICHVAEAEAKLLDSFRRPIVLLEKRESGLNYISENGYVGVMLPYTPLHYLLLGEDIDMLVMTSANLSDTPIVYQNPEAVEKLSGIADGFLLHDRDIQTRCDDSLCWVLNGHEYFARRSRGYVPFPIKLQGSRGRVLACGAEQKASFCLSKEDYVFQSQHIGDLKNMETLENYEHQIRHFERLFDIQPELIACDLHPDYISTEYARSRADKESVPLFQVQHHHAHMASCMADNGLNKPVLALVWDATGYGTDGTIWGGECLAGDFRDFVRMGSLRQIAMPGGDRAAKEISRLAYYLLRDAGCDSSMIANAKSLDAMLKAGLNSPLSSGMGRLFDGVAAILGIKNESSYEGQGAILLESAAESDSGHYSIAFDEAGLCRFDWRPMIREIVAEQRIGISSGHIAARFMNTLVEMAVQMCKKAAEKTGLEDVVLSGGTFQNMYLMQRLPKALEQAGLKPWHHKRVSTNDEGLSLGQLMIAQARSE